MSSVESTDDAFSRFDRLSKAYVYDMSECINTIYHLLNQLHNANANDLDWEISETLFNIVQRHNENPTRLMDFYKFTSQEAFTLLYPNILNFPDKNKVRHLCIILLHRDNTAMLSAIPILSTAEQRQNVMNSLKGVCDKLSGCSVSMMELKLHDNLIAKMKVTDDEVKGLIYRIDFIINEAYATLLSVRKQIIALLGLIPDYNSSKY